MARTRLCNLWSRRQLLVTFLEGHSGGSLLPTSQAAQCLSHTRISKLSTSSNVVAKQPLAAAEDGAAGDVQQVAGGRSLPSSTTDDLESIRLRAWSKISQASPALSGSILPIPLAAQMAFVRRSGTRATSGQALVPNSTDPKGDELATAKFVRVAAILVVFAVGMTTLPKLGSATTDHAVALLTNPKPFWQKSGAARIKSLAANQSAVDRMLQADVASKLVAALSAAPPPEVAQEILGAMDAIAGAENGRQALQHAGAMVSLQAMSQQRLADEQTSIIKSVLYKLMH